ncbi:MAG: hypothetical protein QN159_11760, partial [Armatimonadota bacterium]|nr:hypothetical protein [Armatimonadota bacterium]
MSPGDAVAVYHDLLTDDLAAASQAALDDALRRRGLFFGERALCTVLRPRFLTVEQYRAMRTGLRPLLRALARAHEAAMADPAFRRQFGLREWEEALLATDPGFPAPSPTARLDGFLA